MFDYTKFEQDVETLMKQSVNKWLAKYQDIYIISLDFTREADSISLVANTMKYLTEQSSSDPDDYWYYKYCEEEWELYDDFKEPSKLLQAYLEENKHNLTDPDTHEYMPLFDEHFDKIIEACENALLRLKQFRAEACPQILLTFNIREYLDGDDRIELFEKLNSEKALEEYKEHIDDFC